MASSDASVRLLSTNLLKIITKSALLIVYQLILITFLLVSVMFSSYLKFDHLSSDWLEYVPSLGRILTKNFITFYFFQLFATYFYKFRFC